MSTQPHHSASRLSPDRMSLVTKIARLYHEQGLRQPEIAERLHISQSRVSRFLKEAVALRIVRTVVIPPPGVHPDLEEAVRDKYGLADVVIADTSADDDAAVIAALGAAGAAYLETTLSASDRVGLSSWSSTLLATADAMSPRTVRTASEVVQVIGGVGNPSVQVKATRLTDRFAQVTGGEPKFFHAPGIVGSQAARDTLMEDPYISELCAEWKNLSVLLAGIGSLNPSTLLAASGNAVPESDLALLRDVGAVGDVCLRYFDANGELVKTELDSRVVGISSDDLRAVPRKVGIAGGGRKFEAIHAAALGKWIDVLITDVAVARRLIDA
ncbi:MAG: sugar-binding transcriptional regulator [Demequinaceae bacterium]|nr:sugar-binding transcriptional regulator [Demequinaceae bacterium]